MPESEQTLPSASQANEETIASDSTNARLQKQLSTLETLHQIGAALTSTLETNAVLQMIVEHAAELVGAESSSVLLLEPDTQDLVFQVAVDAAAEKRVPKGLGIVGRVLHKNKAEIINDVSSDPDHYPEIGRDVGTQIDSILAVPLTTDDEKIGVVACINKQEGMFDKHDLKMLTIFTYHAAIALKNARQYEQIQQEIAHRKMTEAALRENEAHLRLLVETAPDAILVAGRSGQILHANSAMVEIFGYSREELLQMEIEDLIPPRFKKRHKGKRESYFDKPIARPLQAGIKLFGMHKTGREFPVDINLSPIQTKTGWEVISIIRDITTEKIAEKALKHYNKRLQILHSLDLAILDAHSPQEIAQVALEHVAQLISCDRLSVATFDLETQSATILSAYSKMPSGLKTGAVVPMKAFAKRTTLQTQDIIVVDLTRKKELSELEQILLQDGIHNYINLPLHAQSEVIGSFNIGFAQSHEATPEQMEVLQEVATQLSVAIYNTSLLKEVTHHAENLEKRVNKRTEELQAALTSTEALFKIASSLITVANLESVLKSIVEDVATALVANRILLFVLDTTTKKILHSIRGGRGRHLIGRTGYAELQKGLSGWVLNEGKPAFSPKEQLDYREMPDIQQQRLDNQGGSIVVVPLRHRDEIFGTMTAVNLPEERDFTQPDIDFMVAVAHQASLAIANAQLFEALQKLATTDELTGIHNRRHLFELGNQEFARARRYSSTLSAIMLDIDHFKQINDTFGHATGDQVLRALAQGCIMKIRDIDIAGRYGGEEFTVLLPTTSRSEAWDVAERLRACVEKYPIQTERGEISITISLGVAELNAEIPDLAALLDRADTALYDAKQNGRNQARMYDPATGNEWGIP